MIKLKHFSEERKRARYFAQLRNTASGKSALGVPENCVGKTYCITVFVAPWCPACKSSQTAFRMLHQYLPANRSDIGFGLVMGSAPLAESKAEQELLSPIEVIIDETGSIFKNRGIRSFPTWVVNDSAGKELFNKSGGIQMTSPEQVPLFLKQFLQL